MPSGPDHIAQAKHNEEFASYLKSKLTYKDWIITVCFYAALHYVESIFFNIPSVRHTVTTIPIEPTTGKKRCSEHAWRMKLVKDNFSEVLRCRSINGVQQLSITVILRKLAILDLSGPMRYPTFAEHRI